LDQSHFPFQEAASTLESEGKNKNLNRKNQMSENLYLLRQNYCRSATVTGKRNRDLFPLEKECEDGKILLAKTPDTLLNLQEFDPYGLHRTYRDESSGAELPVFAVFDLEAGHHISCEITTDLVSATVPSKGLPAYIPFKKTQAFVRKINEGRMNAERVATRLAAILGILLVLTYIFSHASLLASPVVMYVLVGGWILCTFLSYLLSVFLLNRFLPWRKLVISAEFNGILPKDVREKAWRAKNHFDKLYLVVDQQHRWKSSFLPDPRPRLLDPLLIGELRRGRCRKYFLVHQFDLAEAEQYLADEFASKLDEDCAWPTTGA
jgi:hypothetical protein